MTLDKASEKITAIKTNFDGRMKYEFEALEANTYRLIMLDTINDIKRYLNFEIKNGRGKSIDVDFRCDGFYINFPLKKNIDRFTFNLNNFTLMIEYGIKVEANAQMDLDVEF